MMQIVSNDCDYNGKVIATFVDNGDGTGTKTTYKDDGSVNTVEVITGLERLAYPPLDKTGALATLLVVEGLVSLPDAANAVGEDEDHLIHEAQAWSFWS